MSKTHWGSTNLLKRDQIHGVLTPPLEDGSVRKCSTPKSHGWWSLMIIFPCFVLWILLIMLINSCFPVFPCDLMILMVIFRWYPHASPIDGQSQDLSPELKEGAREDGVLEAPESSRRRVRRCPNYRWCWRLALHKDRKVNITLGKL